MFALGVAGHPESYAIGRFGPKAYFEVDLGPIDDGFPITLVMVGPSREQELNIVTVDMLLRRFNHTIARQDSKLTLRW